MEKSYSVETESYRDWATGFPKKKYVGEISVDQVYSLFEDSKDYLQVKDMRWTPDRYTVLKEGGSAEKFLEKEVLGRVENAEDAVFTLHMPAGRRDWCQYNIHIDLPEDAVWRNNDSVASSEPDYKMSSIISLTLDKTVEEHLEDYGIVVEE